MAERGAFETLVAEAGKLLLPLQSALDSPAAFQGLLLKLGWQADSIPQPLRDLAADLEILFTQLQKIVGAGLSIDGSVSLEDGAADIDISLQDVERTHRGDPRRHRRDRRYRLGAGRRLPADPDRRQLQGRIPGAADQLPGDPLSANAPPAGRLRPADARHRQDPLHRGGRQPSVLRRVPARRFRHPEDLREPADPAGERLQLGQRRLRFLGTRLAGRQLRVEPPPRGGARRGAERDGRESGGRRRTGGRAGPQTHAPRVLRPGAQQRPARRRTESAVAAEDADRAAGLRPATRLQRGARPPHAARPDDRGDDRQRPRPAERCRPDRPARPRHRHEPRLRGGGAPTHAKGSLRVTVEFSNPDASPTVILGSGEGTRLQYQSVGGTGGIALNAAEDVEVFVEVELNGLTFIFDPSGSDGFISSILSGVSTEIEFDLALGFAYTRGVYFRGTSHLEIQVPSPISLGPIEVQGLTIALKPGADGIPIDLGATFKAQLGPLAAVVENIGLRSDITFPGQGGNLGPLDLAFALKPPNGIGLSVDAGVIKGGGYLYIDVDRGEYAGALELSFLDFLTLSALAVITTKMPDGSDGFSLIAIINVEFNPGLQLGFGFTLVGVGGLLGLNRTMDLDALVEGVRTGSLDSVVFPSDVVANAPRIISDMRAFFPPEDDIFLVGPMTKFGWGTPTLISLSLGVIIEIPGNIAIVGTLKVAIPDEDAALIIIQVAFIGALEFDKKRGWFFASLYESRVIYMPLEGGMGVLAGFGAESNFVVSVGGFHPAYNPPALPFGSIARIAINILNTPVARIRIDAYFAVTSNTVQFGARAELYFGISIARIEGHLAFDALFQFSPFYFIISISASLSVKVFGAGLFSVRFRGSLEGTSPWHVEGTGSISILFWDIDVDFAHSWGEEKNTTLPPISVMPILVAEFEKLENWTAQLASPNTLLVSLRKIDEPGALVLHPVGSLRITQCAIPLNLTIDKVGNQKPDDADKFAIDAATTGLEKRGTVRESFSMGQFQDMKDSEKLSAADYEQEDAGLELSVTGQQTNSSLVARRNVRYEQIIIDNNFKRAVIHFFTLFTGLFAHFLGNNAVAQSGLSAKHRTQMQPFADKITVKPNAYVVANMADNSVMAGAPASFASRASAREYMNAEIARDPSLAGKVHVIRPHEMQQAA